MSTVPSYKDASQRDFIAYTQTHTSLLKSILYCVLTRDVYIYLELSCVVLHASLDQTRIDVF